MTFTLQRLKFLLILLTFASFGHIQAQECERFGLVSRGFLLGEFSCDLLIVSSDGAEVFQPLEITEELSPGKVIRFSYEVLDSTDCAEDVPLIDITCIEPFFESVDSALTTCNFAIESSIISDTSELTTYQLEVFNQTDFGSYYPQKVLWYEYETGMVIGQEAIITYTPPVNSPPTTNICADISINFPDGSQCASTLCHTIISESIIPQSDACQALFVYQPKDQLADNGVINFYNLSFGEYDQVIWDFGDGQTDTTTASNFVHTYEVPGLYEVCLTLISENNTCSSVFCLPVFTVGGSAICDFNDCVLPGDTNKDGLVNIFDALPLGVGFNSVGEIRPNASIEPILQAAFDWDLATLFNLNFKHIDCDGNGKVDIQDYIAIDNNYQAITENKTLTSDANLPEVSLIFASDTLLVSPSPSLTRVTVPANLSIGSVDKPVQKFYGIALAVTYLNPLITNVTTSYDTTSFLGDQTQTFSNQKLLAEDRQVAFVVTRTDQNSVEGTGDIASFSFILDLDLIEARSQVIELDINDLTVVDEDGEEIPVSVPDDSPQVVVIIDDSFSVNTEEELTDQQFSIYPNPATTSLGIQLGEAIDLTEGQLMVFNTLGQRIWHQSINKYTTVLEVGEWAKGVYWVKIQTKSGIGIKEIVVE